MTYPTLIKPPPPSPNKSPIEDVLELTPLFDINPNLFTNTRPLWHPPGARGIYGGAAIAQCLAAAQLTIPAGFLVHSMHCYFVLNGNADIPLIYHVERVRTGRSFATRTVQARQRGQPIFTTTISFMREGSGGARTVEHAATMPADIHPPVEDMDEDEFRGKQSPFVSQRCVIEHADSPYAHKKRTRQWIKAKGRISEEGGHQAHLSAMAYMSDSYFIGTVARVHKLHRDQTDGPRKQEVGNDTPEIGMMVSLDHTIYFHSPKDFRADEWLFSECDSPWSGDGRGLVHQRIYRRDGLLVATCVQEGVVRLKQPKQDPAAKL